MTFEAGADLLLMPADFPKAYEGILTAIEDGTITEARVDESVKRILKAKFSQEK
jgi:beta-N-acetylhexosaminidase